MRSTIEILCAVKECKPVTPEELRLALLVMSSIEHYVRQKLMKLIETVKADKVKLAKFWAVESEKLMESMFKARKADPLTWLGPANIPGNPEFDKFYAAGVRLIERLEKEQGTVEA